MFPYQKLVLKALISILRALAAITAGDGQHDTASMCYRTAHELEDELAEHK